MADETVNTANNNEEVSMQDFAGAFTMTLAELMVDTNNHLKSIYDALSGKEKLSILDAATRPNMSKSDRQTSKLTTVLSSLSNQISILARNSNSNLDFNKLNVSINKLTQTLENNRKQQEKSARNAARKTKKAEAEDLYENFTSIKYNKLIKSNPALKYLPFHKYATQNARMSDIFRLSASSKLLDSIPGGGFIRNRLNTWSAGRANAALGYGSGNLSAGLGMFLKGGALSLAIAGAVEAFKFYGQVIKRALSAGAHSETLKQRTGEYISERATQQRLGRMTLMGYSHEEAQNKILEFAKYGVTDTRAIMSGAVSEKLFGAENVAQFTQQMSRRGNLSAVSNDLTKVFQSLKVIVRDTGLSMQELQGGMTTFFSSIKGGGFESNKISAIMSKYSDLIKSGNISVQDIARMYGQHQTMSRDQLLTYTYFAQQGGFDPGGGSLLANAYRIRHMRGGDTDQAALLRQAGLRGTYQQLFGKNRWAELTEEEKFTASEAVFSDAFGFDVAKAVPEKIDDFMKLVDAGLTFDKMPEEFKKGIEDAQKSDSERILQGVKFLQNPLDQIRNLLFMWFSTKDTLDFGIKSYVSKVNEAEGLNKLMDNTKQETRIHIDYADGLKVETSAVAGGKPVVINKNKAV